MYFIGLTPWAFHLASLVQRPPVLRRQLFDFRVQFVTLRPWKRVLSASDFGPTPRRVKSDFLSVIADISAQAQCFVRGSLMPLLNCLLKILLLAGKGITVGLNLTFQTKDSNMIAPQY